MTWQSEFALLLGIVKFSKTYFSSCATLVDCSVISVEPTRGAKRRKTGFTVSQSRHNRQTVVIAANNFS